MKNNRLKGNTATLMIVALSFIVLFSSFTSAFSYSGATATYENNYIILTFNQSGTFNISSSISNIEVLIVAGGGGGGPSGTRGSAGGGAGGLVYSNSTNLTTGNYNISVGIGGLSNANGTNSSFYNMVAKGGGSGGTENNKGDDGGSGGGGGNFGSGIGNARQGNVGDGLGFGSNGALGSDTAPNRGAGGGGGSGGAGTAGSSTSGGAGGPGKTYSINGTAFCYAGGGGGGSEGGTIGSATCGGGNGVNSGVGTNAINGTGGGGGGAGPLSAGGIGGTGVVILRIPYIGVTLNSPQNNSESLSNQQITFNWTSNGQEEQLVNTTLFFNGGLNQTISLTGLINTTTVNKTLSQGSYNWTVQSCTASVCRNSTTRYFTISNIITGSISYNTNTYETQRESFTLTMNTSVDILSISAKLNYNGTNYTSSSSCSGIICTINNTIDIPLITSGETQNHSFFWYVTIFAGSTSQSITSSTSQQNSTRIHLEVCNATNYTTTTLNFTAYREDNLTRISPFAIAGTFFSWLGGGDVQRNQSFNNQSTPTLALCLTPTNTNMFIDAHMDYGFENANLSYTPRNYFFQNATLTSTAQNISLYLLEPEDSTTFIQKVQDQDLAPVIGALIYTQRYYPSDGQFRTVQISKTSDSGKTVGFYQVEEPDYKHIIIKDNEILLETTQEKIVGEEVPFTLTFTVGGALATPWSFFEKDSNIASSISFNKTTNIVTFSYVDITGSTTSGRLIVYKPSMSNSTNTTICDSSSSQSSASITCNMTGYEGNFYAIGYVESNDTDVLQFLITTARTIFGNEGVIMGFFIILIAGFAFIWNPVAGVIGVEVALIAVNLIGLLTLSPIFIFGSLAVALIMIILLKS